MTMGLSCPLGLITLEMPFKKDLLLRMSDGWPEPIRAS